MGEEEDAENQLKTLIDYLGYIDHGNIRFSQDNKMEDEILNGILSAINEHKKFFIQVNKTFSAISTHCRIVEITKQSYLNSFFNQLSVKIHDNCIQILEVKRFYDLNKEFLMILDG